MFDFSLFYYNILNKKEVALGKTSALVYVSAWLMV